MSFIYLFLPLVCLVYFLVKAEFRNTVLLIASIIFYGWGEPNYLAVMIMTIVLIIRERCCLTGTEPGSFR